MRSKLPVRAGSGWVTASSMLDSTALVESGNIEAARHRLAKDGYLLLRGYLPEQRVLQVNAFLLQQLRAWKPDSLSEATDGEDGIAAPGACQLGMLQRQDLAAHPLVQQVLEAPELYQLMEALMQVPEVITTGYKWLRAVAKGEFTGVHTDRVFLGRGSSRVLTAWLPLGKVAVEDGALMVCRGSHRSRNFAKLKAGYGQTQVGADGTQSGWFSDDGAALAQVVNPFAIDWRTSDYLPGDVLVLGMDVVHMTACNTSERIRLSCDTRWQPAEDKRDERLSVWHSKHDKPC